MICASLPLASNDWPTQTIDALPVASRSQRVRSTRLARLVFREFNGGG